MRTNIDLDDKLVARAFEFAEVNTKRDLVHLALEEFVRNHSRQDLRELRGKITFLPNYDYKKLRRDAEPDE